MKTTLSRLLPFVFLAWMAALPALAEQKIATVDYQKVLEKYWRREQATTFLRDRKQSYDKELKGLMEDANKVAGDYEKLRESSNDQVISKEERDKRKALADNKFLELKTADNNFRAAQVNYEEGLRTQEKRLYEAIFGEINDAIKAKAKEGGYALVLNSATPGNGSLQIANVLFTNGENDLTDAVIAQLNVGAPAKAASGENPKAGDKAADKGSDKKQ